MPSWGDVISFVLTFSLFAGVIAGGMFIQRSLNQTVASTKQSLKEKGLNLSDGTLHIKTSGRYSHEAYVDATQKAFIDGAKRMQAAGSFGHADDIYRVASPPSVPNSPSLANGSPGPSRSNTMPSPAPARRSSSSYSRSESMGSGAMSPPRRKESNGGAAPSAFRAPSVGFAPSPGPPKRSASAGSIDDMGRYGSPEPEDGSGKKKKGIFGALKRRGSDKKK